MSEPKGKLAGAAGLHGTEYQIKLYMLFLLRGYTKNKNFRLSAEDKIGGKFDDLVFEENEEIILLQAKHIDNEDKKLSPASVFAETGRFSLIKYLDSCKQLKLDQSLKKTYILCTNIHINKDLSDKYMSQIAIEQTSPLYNLDSNIDQYFYAFKHFESVKMLKDTKNDIREEDALLFLSNLRLVVIKDSEIDHSIKEMLRQCLLALDNQLNTISAYDFIFNKLKSWFSDKKLTYLTKIHLDAYFLEMLSTIFLENLTKHHNKISLSDIHLPGDKQVIIIETSRHLILMLKLHLQSIHENRQHVLFVNPKMKTFQQEMLNAFQLPCFTHLICGIFDENVKSMKEYMETMLLKITHQTYKRVIILVQSRVLLNCSQTIVNLTDRHLYKDVKIGKHFKINFDNTKESFYIRRTYVETCNPNNSFTEDIFLNMLLQNDKKILILKDIPGMGKSTAFSHLTNTINQTYENLLAAKLDLNNFTHLFQCFSKVNRSLEIDDFFDLHSTFDRQLLSLPGMLVLLFDGLDEICSDYIDLFLKFVKNSYTNNRIIKLIISTRPHVENFIKDAHIYEMGNTFHLKSLTKNEQHDFISEYWMAKLSFKENEERKRCRNYAELLMGTLSSTISDSETLIGIPLLITMISEIFQEQACRFCFNQQHPSEGNDVRLESWWNISRLYDMFIARQKDIFIEEKALAKGNKFTTDALTNTFQNALELCCNLALNVIFPNNISKRFIEKSFNDIGIVSLCDTGLVTLSRGDVRFIHRTFGEYLIAKRLFTKVINGNAEDIKYVILNIFDSWDYEAIHRFFNGILEIEWKNMELISSDIFGSIMNAIYYLEHKKPALYQLIKHKCTCTLKLLLNKCDISKDILNTLDPIFVIQEDNPLYYYPGSSIRNCFYYLPKQLNSIGKKSSAPLHCAVYYKYLEIVKYFVDKGADIESKTTHGISVLHVAVDREDFNIIKYLIDKGANINVRSRNGSSILHFAALNGNVDISNYLIKIGLNLYARTGVGETVLHKAALGKNLDLVKYFIDKGIDIHAKTGTGVTALHYAVLVSNFAIVKYLVEKGADVNAQLIEGISVLHKAVKADNLEIVKFLIENGANVNAISKFDSTPLSVAVERANLEIIKCLVENGADIFHMDQKGNTILQKAIHSGQHKNIEYLTEKCLNS